MDYLHEERRKVVDVTTAEIAQEITKRGYCCVIFKNTNKQLLNSFELCLKGRYGIVKMDEHGLGEETRLFIPEFYNERRRERILRKFRRETEEIKKFAEDATNKFLEILEEILS